MSRLRVATCCLAEDLRVGDRLTDAGLGGSFDADVESVRVGPDKWVYVDTVDDFGKATRLCFTRTEMLGVLRPAGRQIDPLIDSILTTHGVRP